VISEAMAARVPVLISDKCGAAAQVAAGAGAVLSLNAPLHEWVAAASAQLNRTQPPPPFIHGWDAVAQEYETIYSSCGDSLSKATCSAQNEK
jgi:UDP-glucose:(heptosyl)LPS alpha-1,3-glucosyltransferase